MVAIELTPAWGAAYFYRGRLHARRERFEQASADLERAADLGLGTSELFPVAEIDLLDGRVSVSLRLGRVVEALALLDDAILTRPDWITVHVTKVLSLVRLGRGEDAPAA